MSQLVDGGRTAYLAFKAEIEDPENVSLIVLEELITNTRSIMSFAYGYDSSEITELNNRILLAERTKDSWRLSLQICYAKLEALKFDIENGLLGNVRLENQGLVLSDMLSLAENNIDSSVSVSAVLACATLEDTLKVLAREKGSEKLDAGIKENVSFLKSKGVIKGPSVSLLTGFSGLRNKTFHAQWEDISKEEVVSLIGFLKEFLLKNVG